MSAKHTVLAPNAELAAALIDAVERYHRQAGHALWPTPRVRDFTGWLRDAHLRRQLEDASFARCLSDLEERELWREAVAESEAGGSFLDPEGAAQAARRARRAMVQHDIPFSAIAHEPTEEARALTDWIRRFERRSRDLDCLSQDELLATFEAAPEPILWIESPAWWPAARRWLASHGRQMLPPQPAEDRDAPRVQSFPSLEAEAAGAAEWARMNLLRNAEFRAWICIPDLGRRRAEFVDAFDAALAPQRFSLSTEPPRAPYAVAGGSPLADYPPVRAALGLLRAADDMVRFEQFSDALRSPALHAFAVEAGDAARLDLELRARAPSEAPLPVWLELAERVRRERGIRPVSALPRLSGALKALERLRGSQLMSQWIPVWISAFELGPWAERGRWSSGEYQSAERLRELLRELATADALFGARSRVAAQRILAAAARETAFQPQTGVQAVSLSAQLLDPWLRYDGIWVAGMGEGAWPPPIDPIALLPQRLQRQYGVVSAAAQSQLQFARDLQGRWAARARHCVFSYARTREAAGAGMASPLLPRDAGSSAEAAPGPRPHWQHAWAHAPVLECRSDDIAPPFGAGERTGGAETLTSQSRCAFRGFAAARLLCDKLARPAEGFSTQERGTLVHLALQHVWSSLADHAALGSLQPLPERQLLDSCVERALAEVCAKRDPGERWRRRERQRMPTLLAKWLAVERGRAPFAVEGLEQRETLQRAGLEFSLRIDRIDRLPDGARVLIDYKSGLAAADWRGARPDRAQLPIYALVQGEGLVAVAYAQVNAAECRFVGESQRDGLFRQGGKKTSLEGAGSFARLLEIWSARIERLAAEFAAGYAMVAPTPRACANCHLQALCRIPGAQSDEARERD